jgi:hypothetical protein
MKSQVTKIIMQLLHRPDRLWSRRTCIVLFPECHIRARTPYNHAMRTHPNSQQSQTTRLTCCCVSTLLEVSMMSISTHLEEPLQPPHLESAVCAEDENLEDAPPLDAGIGALGGVPVCPLTDNNVALLVLDL